MRVQGGRRDGVGKRRAWFISICLALTALALPRCSDEGASTRSSPPASPAVVTAANLARGAKVSPSFDMGAVVDRVHFAFRPAEHGAGFEGGHNTYGVRVATDGGARLEAVRWDGRERAMKSAPLVLSTIGNVRSVAVDEDGGIAIDRGWATETLRNTRDGLMQSWAFAARPDRDVVVRVRMTGMGYAGVTDGGLHFRDPKTGLGFRYGWATWVSGDGVKTPVRGVWEGDEIVMRVPAEAVASATYPAVLDPSVTPEFGMDAPVYGPAYQDNTEHVSAAAGASCYLVAWRDERYTADSVIAARVGLDGALLDPTGIWLPSVRILFTGGVDVAFDGTNFLVAYGDIRSTHNDVWGARITQAGQLLDSDGFAISNAINSQQEPTVAFTGTHYLVAWTDTRSSPMSVYAARVLPDATILDPTGFAVSSVAGENPQVPDVACDGTCLVVWRDFRNGKSDIYGTRVTGDRAVLDGATAGIPIATETSEETYPTVTMAGTRRVASRKDSL